VLPSSAAQPCPRDGVRVPSLGEGRSAPGSRAAGVGPDELCSAGRGQPPYQCPAGLRVRAGLQRVARMRSRARSGTAAPPRSRSVTGPPRARRPRRTGVQPDPPPGDASLAHVLHGPPLLIALHLPPRLTAVREVRISPSERRRGARVARQRRGRAVGSHGARGAARSAGRSQRRSSGAPRSRAGDVAADGPLPPARRLGESREPPPERQVVDVRLGRAALLRLARHGGGRCARNGASLRGRALLRGRGVGDFRPCTLLGRLGERSPLARRRRGGLRGARRRRSCPSGRRCRGRRRLGLRLALGRRRRRRRRRWRLGVLRAAEELPAASAAGRMARIR
jgi:hypothetical protein